MPGISETDLQSAAGSRGDPYARSERPSLVKATLDTAGLRRELALRGMNQTDLAHSAGVTEVTVSHAMAGRPVSYLTIRSLARALTTTPTLPGAENIIGTQRESGVEGRTSANQAAS